VNLLQHLVDVDGVIRVMKSKFYNVR
jgi:hypothetical protein